MSSIMKVPDIKNVRELKKHISPLYIISDYMDNDADYLLFQDSIYTIIKGCFDKEKGCRTYPVKFKFYKNDEKTYTLELRHFVINLFLWRPFVEVHELEVLDEDFIFDCVEGTKGDNLSNFINDKIITVLRNIGVPYNVITFSISELLNDLTQISVDFSLIMGLPMNTELFIDIYKSDDEMKSIMTTTFPETMQPAEVEANIDKLLNRAMTKIKKMDGNPLSVMLNAGTGIKPKQLAEFMINGGFKPSLEGKTMPIPMNTNTLIGGLRTASMLYTDACGAKKSLLLNKKTMGKAGYFGKIVIILARTLALSKTVSDCGTKHLLRIDIKTEKHLKKLDKRFYKLNEENTLKLINAKTDKFLIGKTILLRSPVTCGIKDDPDHICEKCYGANAIINYDIADGIAAYGSEEITKEINQNILSAKHLLTTLSTTIKFNDEFYNFFSVLLGDIVPNIIESPIKDIDRWEIYVDENDIEKNDDMDDDGIYNTYIVNGRFYLENRDTGERIIIQEQDEKELFFTEESFQLMKEGKGRIRLSDVDDVTSIFIAEIDNNELTKPLYDIMDLLNKKRNPKRGEELEEISIHSMTQNILDLLVEAGINASSVQGELIVNRLIRDKHNEYERADFSKNTFPEYSILTVRDALILNKSPLIGLSYQNIKDQLMSDDMFTKRTSTSYLDTFFKKNVRTSLFDKYIK